MIAELGHLAVVLAFMVALVQMIIPLIGARADWSNWMAVAAPAALVQAALLIFSFGALTWA
ncbi:MAG: hypothetical protein AAF245_06955, partial [Pseudomonadota bacterium]